MHLNGLRDPGCKGFRNCTSAGQDYTICMIDALNASTDNRTLIFGLRHLQAEREILVLKVTGQNFYAFPPYAKAPLGCLDNHMSWHRSGERHAVSKYYDGKRWNELASTRRESRIKLQPPSALKGVGFLCHIVCGVGVPFVELSPLHTNTGQLCLLNAEGAGFRDDAFFVRAYLVEPGAEDQIPISADTGPRILHLVRRAPAPWLAVEVFQHAARLQD
jgi:hypothetical protein